MRRRPKSLLALAVAALLGGCLPPRSVHPLYTEKDLVAEPALLGDWVAEDTVWTFSRKDEKAYDLVIVETGAERAKSSFVGRLLKLKGRMYLDVVPKEPVFAKGDLAKEFFLPLHTFVRVDRIGPDLQLAIGDDEKLKKHLEAHPKALKHELSSEGLVLTASTAELQDFVLKNDAMIYEKPVVLARAAAPAPPAAGAPPAGVPPPAPQGPR
ncbi:MAG: hypothetical protein HY927_09300 [Elusimicrobia bacterium]|nr:hypothetical protein [Elusimicrobiota bacterium]